MTSLYRSQWPDGSIWRNEELGRAVSMSKYARERAQYATGLADGARDMLAMRDLGEAHMHEAQAWFDGHVADVLTSLGLEHRVFVDGEPMTVEEFRERMQNLIDKVNVMVKTFTSAFLPAVKGLADGLTQLDLVLVTE